MIYIVNVFIVIFLLINACSNKTNPVHITIKKTSINEAIEEIITNTDKDINIGIMAIDANSEKVIFSKNANRHFVPASSQKIITLAAALHYLGPSYRFNTYFLTDNYDHHTKTIDNLYIKGSGDPGLMEADIIKMVIELRQMGITNIKGNVFVDDTIFDDVLWSKGAMWDDRTRGYNAPVCGLNINYNKILIKTKPNFVTNHDALISIEPLNDFIKLTKKVTTSNLATNISMIINHDSQSISWPSIDHQGLKKNDEIVISGTIALNSNPSYYSLAVHDPAMMLANIVNNQLKLVNINFSGDIVRKQTPNIAKRLVIFQSRTLSEALIDFIKISNDMACDALVKAIAAKENKAVGTYNTGLSLIKTFLEQEVGIKKQSIIVADGSGLSRYNLITPKQLVDLLYYAHNKFYLGPELMVALPIAGSDGTLINRLRKNNNGYVRAKTGSMSGINSLAGYSANHKNQKIIFAIMINGFIGNSYKYTQLQDKILDILNN